MNKDQFYSLTIGQVIWYKNQAYEIRSLSKEIEDCEEINKIAFFGKFSFQWDKICGQCSLEETLTPLPCPFCGEDKEISHVDKLAYHYYVCERDNCGAEGPAKDNKNEAIRAWNKRV